MLFFKLNQTCWLDKKIARLCLFKLFHSRSLNINKFIKVLNNYPKQYQNLLNEMIERSTKNIAIIDIEEVGNGKFIKRDGHFNLYLTREMNSFLGVTYVKILQI